MPQRGPSGWRLWWLGARPRTLPAAIAPVVVGTAGSVGDGGSGDGIGSVIWWRFACALAVAVFVQVATNYANDYSDGIRGTDAPGERVGPPRLVGDGLASPGRVKRAMLVCFGLTVLAGAPLVLLVDWRLALVGVAAVAAGWFYTGGANPYGYAGLGELFVFVFFGLVATVGTRFVYDRTIESGAWVGGVAMGFLASAILLANNVRDIDTDRDAGKRTLAVIIGRQPAVLLYALCVLGGVLTAPVGVVFDWLPAETLLTLLTLPIALRLVRNLQLRRKGPELIKVLKGTARLQLIVALLLSLGIVLP